MRLLKIAGLSLAAAVTLAGAASPALAGWHHGHHCHTEWHHHHAVRVCR